MKKATKQGLLVLAPAIAAFAEILYLPHFGRGQYSQLINYLEFRGYLFLFLFIIAGLVTIAWMVKYREEKSWLIPLLGIILCYVSLNLVYLWSTLVDPLLFNSIFYVETEDYNIYYVNSGDAWLAIGIGIAVCLIGVTQGFILGASTREKIFKSVCWGALFGVIGILPLPLDVYFFDKADWYNHVTLNFASHFTNADLFYVCTVILVLSSACLTLAHARSSLRLHLKVEKSY